MYAPKEDFLRSLDCKINNEKKDKTQDSVIYFLGFEPVTRFMEYSDHIKYIFTSFFKTQNALKRQNLIKTTA